MSTDYTAMDGGELIAACGSDASKWAAAFRQTASKLGYELDEGWLIGWFANAIMRALDEKRWADEKKLNAAEALYGFAGWLTSRREPVTFSATHDAAIAVNLVEEFRKRNDVGDVGPNWPNNLKPTEST